MRVSTPVGDNGLEHCDKALAAIAVVEPQNGILAGLRRDNLSSPVSLIRMMIQQSNCFIVLERGVGMQNMMQERQLAAGGQSREGSNIGGGQMVAADFIMTRQSSSPRTTPEEAAARWPDCSAGKSARSPAASSSGRRQ